MISGKENSHVVTLINVKGCGRTYVAQYYPPRKCGYRTYLLLRRNVSRLDKRYSGIGLVIKYVVATLTAENSFSKESPP
jgi:hypothetical protein